MLLLAAAAAACVCVLCAAAMLLFVSLLFLLFLVGFIALGYLRFPSFYSFVFQRIEVCLLCCAEIRSFNSGVQFAAAACMLCLCCSSSRAVLLLLLTLLGVGGRLLALGLLTPRKQQTCSDNIQETITKDSIQTSKKQRMHFFAGAALQLVALVGIFAIIFSMPKIKGVDGEERQQQQQQRTKNAVLGVCFLASLLDLLLLCAQIAAFQLKDKFTDRRLKAAISLAGGYLGDGSSILCLVGRPHINYDIETAQWTST